MAPCSLRHTAPLDLSGDLLQRRPLGVAASWQPNVLGKPDPGPALANRLAIRAPGTASNSWFHLYPCPAPFPLSDGPYHFDGRAALANGLARAWTADALAPHC